VSGSQVSCPPVIIDKILIILCVILIMRDLKTLLSSLIMCLICVVYQTILRNCVGVYYLNVNSVRMFIH
jgi:hypothetical protein